MTPLVSRVAAVEAALGIVDDEGPEALSLPRLARALGSTVPALRRHFKHRDELLAAVAEAVVEQIALPRRKPGGDWVEWCTTLSLNIRAAVLRHRRAAPILLAFMPGGLLADVSERAAVYLRESGVPTGLHVLILDGLDKLALGGALIEGARPPTRGSRPFGQADPDRHPALTAAAAADRLTARQLFEHTVRGYLLSLTR